MLTLDDLDHFDTQDMAHLFIQASLPPDAAATARRARILACLNFCRDIPDAELSAGGLQVIRGTLRSLLHCVQRKQRLEPGELADCLEDAQRALGRRPDPGAEPAHAAPERHAVEAEIQAAARKLHDAESHDAALLDALACGQFEILPSSDFAALIEGSGKFAEAIGVDVEFWIDGETPDRSVRVHLAVHSGFWHWIAQEGCHISHNGCPPEPLAPGDGVVQALLAGLALHNGHTIASWAYSVSTHRAAMSLPRADAGAGLRSEGGAPEKRSVNC